MSQPIPGLVLNAAIADAVNYGNGYIQITRLPDGSKRYERLAPEQVKVASLRSLLGQSAERERRVDVPVTYDDVEAARRKILEERTWPLCRCGESVIPHFPCDHQRVDSRDTKETR